MADKKDSIPSIVDFVASLVSKSDSRGVDNTYSSVVKDKAGGGDLSPEEESKVDKIAKRFGNILKIGAFAEPEARRLSGTSVSGVKGTEAIKDKTATIDAGKVKSEEGFFSSILGKIGSALGKVGGIAAIAGIAALFILKDSIAPILQTITTFFVKVLDKMPKVLEAIGAAIPPIIDSLGSFFSRVLEKMPPVISAIGAAIPPIIDSLGPFFSRVLEKMPPIISAIGAVIPPIIDSLTPFFTSVLEQIPKVLETIGAAIPPIIDSLGPFFTGVLEKMLPIISAIGAAIPPIIDSLGPFFSRVLEKMPPIIDSLFNGLSKLSPVITTLFDELAKADWSTLSKAGVAILGLGALGAIVSKIGLGNMAKGALGITLLSGALFTLTKALDPFSKLDWSAIAKAGIALAGLGQIGKIFGKGKKSLSTLAKGAAGLTLLGGALWVLGEKGLKPFASLDWPVLAIGLTTVAGFGVLGRIAGAFAPKLLLGALAIGAIGLALIPFAKAANIAAPALEKVIGAFSNLLGNVLEKMPPLVEEIGILITGVIDSVSGGINSMIDTLSGGVTRVLDGVKGIIKESGDTIVNIANGVSDSISRFFDRLADTILKLNGVDTTKLKEIGPALSSIGEGLAKFGAGGFFENILSGLGSLFGADSPLEKFQKLGEVAPKIQSLPKALEELSKYTNFKFLNDIDIDASTTSINNLNAAAWNLKGTLEKLKENSKDLENITGGTFDIKTLNTVADTNIKNLTTDTTEYHNFARTAMQDQIKRQDVMIDLLRQLVMKPTGSTSINTSAPMQPMPSKTFDIRDQFNAYTSMPNNLLAL